jgi:archaellum component FlaC
MASAELLRISHDVEGRVIRVDEGVQDVGRDVRDVGDKVEGVHCEVQEIDRRVEDVDNGVQDVLKTVQCVGDGVQDVQKMVQGVGDGVQDVQKMVQDVGDGMQDVQQMVQRVDDKVDQVNRQSSLNVYGPRSSNLTNLSQGTTSENAFNLGSLLQIRRLIITSHAALNIKEQLNGSFAAQFLINGNLLVLSCGYMENVCSSCQFSRHQF